jgi:hypothetical protein
MEKKIIQALEKITRILATIGLFLAILTAFSLLANILAELIF